MIHTSGTAAMSPTPSVGGRWPVTTDAWRKLDAEVGRLTDEVARLATAGGHDQADGTGPDLRALAIIQAGRRRERLRAVLANARIVDDPSHVVIGRRFTLREDDGSAVIHTLVAPGEGDPSHGRISADSPLGMAIIGRRTRDTVEIAAPAGTRTARVEWVW